MAFLDHFIRLPIETPGLVTVFSSRRKLKNTYKTPRSTVHINQNVGEPRQQHLISKCLWAYLIVGIVCTQASPPLEYKVKGAFIYNFTKFIQWSPESLEDHDVFIVGLFGEDRFGNTLDLFHDKTIHGKRVEIRRFNAIRELEFCHILFISSSEKERFPTILSSIDNRNVLTIGECDDFTDRGGIINFLTVAGKIRFQINHEAAKESNLKISSNLLMLAVNSQFSN